MSTLTSSISCVTQRSRAASSEVCSVTARMRLMGDATIDFNHSKERVKTSTGSSDDSSSIYADGFVHEAFRSGGPSLCEVPIATLPIPRELMPSNEHHMYNMVQSFLRDGGILNAEPMFFCLRYSANDESQQVPTLYIQATKTRFDDSWLETSRFIHGFLCDNKISFSVEIADVRAFEQIQFFPVRPDDAIYPCWSDVCRSILAFCHPYEMNAVGCFRMGRSHKWEENSPTVYMAVDPNTESDWKDIRDLVLDILELYSLPMVGIRIQRDRVVRCVEISRPDMPSSALQAAVHVGQSIGVRGNADVSGTFGGIIELKDKETGQWVKLGITCSHCVLFDSNPELTKSGIRPGQEDQIDTDTPSLKDLEGEVRQMTERINEIESKEQYLRRQRLLQGPDPWIPGWEKDIHDRDLEEIRELERNQTGIRTFRAVKGHQLGRVFAASGETVFKASTINSELDSILDWALVEIPDTRIGANDVMTFGTPGKRSRFNKQTKVLRTWVPQVLEDYCLPLFKVGRSTGFTEGFYSGLKTAHLEKEIVNGEQHVKGTMEHTVIGRGGAEFSQPGDSGSLVMDEYGFMVGLLFGGHQTSPLSYFTHHIDLTQNILEVTGAADIRVMG